MKPNLFIGVMSGTSIDSVDAALMKINPKSWSFIGGHTIKFPKVLKYKLRELSRSQYKIDLKTLIELNYKTGHLFAKCVNKLLFKESIDPSSVKAIGLHGQTIMHHTATNFPGSLQIGDAALVAKETGITVVSNFRNNDIASGGEGAPFAPLFHSWLFLNKKVNRILINIGGVSNISLLLKNGNYKGYDIGPGNILMDSWSIANKKGDFDLKGQWAITGNINYRLLSEFKKDAFFKRKPPKSTGTDYFNLKWIKEKISINNKSLATADVQATLTELTVDIILDAIKEYPKESEIAFCGGGIKNNFLMSRIKHKLNKKINLTSDWGIESKWVEAAGFSYLSKKRIDKIYSDLRLVTGSNVPTMLGGVFLPPEKINKLRGR
jgi:anhydro-N-acetylmuramic acid kinase